ncbi:MAG: carboxypeptidase-like regulatory domain-containing protein, partial [Saprospiraceae bacterium]
MDKKKYYFIALLIVLVILKMNAQFTVSGTVISESGAEPLIGATILEQGTANGTTTDLDGKFVLDVSGPTATISISYVGFSEMIIPIDSRPLIDIVLKESGVLIDQVVVVGYGVQKKSDLTGAVSSLKGEEIQRIPTPNFAQALQGKIAGVYASPPSG